MRNANFVVLPTIIKQPGQYRTRSGEIVTIVKVAQRHPDSAVSPCYAAKGNYPCGIKEHWDVSGRIYPSMKSGNDILEAT